jgi:hypothetical protein
MRKHIARLLLVVLLGGTSAIVSHANYNQDKKQDPVDKGKEQGKKDSADYTSTTGDKSSPKPKKDKSQKPKSDKKDKKDKKPS